MVEPYPYPVGPVPTVVIPDPYPVDPVTVTVTDPYPVDPIDPVVTVQPDPTVINVPDPNFEQYCWDLNLDPRDLPELVQSFLDWTVLTNQQLHSILPGHRLPARLLHRQLVTAGHTF